MIWALLAFLTVWALAALAPAADEQALSGCSCQTCAWYVNKPRADMVRHRWPVKTRIAWTYNYNNAVSKWRRRGCPIGHWEIPELTASSWTGAAEVGARVSYAVALLPAPSVGPVGQRRRDRVYDYDLVQGAHAIAEWGMKSREGC